MNIYDRIEKIERLEFCDLNIDDQLFFENLIADQIDELCTGFNNSEGFKNFFDVLGYEKNVFDIIKLIDEYRYNDVLENEFIYMRDDFLYTSNQNLNTIRKILEDIDVEKNKKDEVFELINNIIEDPFYEL